MFQQLINAIVFGSILTLFALGLSLSWGTLDVLNLGHGAVFIFAGFLAYEFSKDGTLGFIPTILVSMAAAGVITALLELVAFRHIRERFRSKRQAELSTLVASIGAATALNQIVSNETGDTTFGPSQSLFTVHNYKIGSAGITNVEIIIIVVAAVASILLGLFVQRSRFGRAIRSVAVDASTSELLGINVNVVATVTMFLAGALAGLAGVLLAVNLGTEDVSTGQDYLLTAFAILIVGGVGSIRGAVASAYAIAIAETAVIAYGPSQWSDGVAFLLILVMLLLRPQGLFARARFQRV